MNPTEISYPENLLSLPWSLRLLRRLPLPRKLGLLERLYGTDLGRAGVCWIECAHGILWKLDLSDPTQRWCVFGDYEGSVQMDWIRSWLQGGGVVVDSGASIGQMVMYFGKMRDVVVHAFEPTRLSREWLADCVNRNGFVNVEVLPYGLSDETSTRPILLRGTHSTLRLESDPNQLVPREAISTIRLDDFCRERLIERVRLWKLDVEHHEDSALAGAARALESHMIDAILVEVSRATFHLVKDRLSRFGYALFRLGSGGKMREESFARRGFYNLVARPDEAKWSLS